MRPIKTGVLLSGSCDHAAASVGQRNDDDEKQSSRMIGETEDIAGEGKEYVPPLPSEVKQYDKQRLLFHVDTKVVK